MRDQPEATEREHEEAPERMEEHEAMQAPGHENPSDVDPQPDSEIHEA